MTHELWIKPDPCEEDGPREGQAFMLRRLETRLPRLHGRDQTPERDWAIADMSQRVDRLRDILDATSLEQSDDVP